MSKTTSQLKIALPALALGAVAAVVILTNNLSASAGDKQAGCAVMFNRFGFPCSWDQIVVIGDQFRADMSDEQVKFASQRYAGCQKLTLDISGRLRRFKPKFLVLHYHLGIWQQQPAHSFIVDGNHWGNDWNEVTLHESWFWHNEKGERVRSSADGKFLMNIADPGFLAYWKASILAQLKAGKYNGVFLDSSSIDMLHVEASQMDPRLMGTAARTRVFVELEHRSWSQAYEKFMSEMTRSLEEQDFAVIPNINAQFTTWDTTDYFTTASGAFVEGAFATRSSEDWKMACERILKLVSADKIVMFQSTLPGGDGDYASRMYYLACYLLLKGKFTYINYFSGSPLSWYPEFEIKLGVPKDVVTTLAELAEQGVYHRQYGDGEVWVNPTSQAREVTLGRPAYLAMPRGGGPVPEDGRNRGSLNFKSLVNLSLEPWSGAILSYSPPKL